MYEAGNISPVSAKLILLHVFPLYFHSNLLQLSWRVLINGEGKCETWKVVLTRNKLRNISRVTSVHVPYPAKSSKKSDHWKWKESVQKENQMS